MDDPCRQGFLQRLSIHVRDHQDVAASVVDRNTDDQAFRRELRKEVASFLQRLLSRAGALMADQCAPRKSVKKRVCSLGTSRNTPVNCVVTVETPCLRTPRIDMHICSASTSTATP